MAELTITPKNFTETHELRIGQDHKIVIKNYSRHVIEIEDLHFHHDSAVMLPDYVDYDDTDDLKTEHLSGIEMIARSYREAQDNPSQKALIAGHTDTTGEAGYNLTLSRLRANDVLALLLGNKSSWVDIAIEKHKTEDIQQILRWIAFTWMWDCDPETVNDQMTAKTKTAIKNFQTRFNTENDAKLPESGTVEKKTWEAFYEMYIVDLKAKMKTDDAGLDAARKKIHFLDDKRQRVGCGENFPIDKRGVDSYKSATNRRVEILFFDPGEEPKMDCHPSDTKCVPSVCQLYKGSMFKPVHIPAKPVPPPPPPKGILEITKIDDHFAPSAETLDFTYKIQTLGAKEVKFQVLSAITDYKTKGESVVFERVLDEEEKKDGDSKSLKTPWKGEVNSGSLKDAASFINPMMGPFKLRLVSGDVKAESPFKVLYHSIKLHMGAWTPDDKVPDESSKNDFAQYKLNELGYFGGPVGHDTDGYLKKAVIRYKANHKKLHQLDYSKYTETIDDDLIDALKKNENKRDKFFDPKVFEDSSKTSEILVEALTYEVKAEFSLAKGKVLKEKERLNRPLLPVEVDILVKKKDDSGVFAPAAVGPARVNWKVKDADEDISGLDEKKANEPSMTKQYVELCLKLHGGRSGGNGDNCHKDFAGIRDDKSNWDTPFLLGDADVPYTAVNDAGNKVVYSTAWTAKDKFPGRVGRAGLFFRPSYVAGDDYKLAGAVVFAGAPNKADLETAHGYSADEATRIKAESGSMVIKRFGNVAFNVTWPARKNSNDWDQIAAEFKKAHLAVDVKNISSKAISDAISEADYKTIVTSNTAHTDPAKVKLLNDSFVGVDLPAQGTSNAAVYKQQLKSFVYGNFWDKIKYDLGTKFSQNLRKEKPIGFIIVDFMTHKPVAIMNDPSPKSAADPSPKDPTITDKNKAYITWSSSIGMSDSVILADQKDPDKVYYVVGHEMGHNLFLHHWEHAGGMSPAEHDQSDHNCIMSYSTGDGFQKPGDYTPRFCGKCNLKLRGWDVEAGGIPDSSAKLTAGPAVEARIVDGTGTIVAAPTPKVNDRLALQVVLTNVGPDQATGVKVTYKLPVGVTLLKDKANKDMLKIPQGTYDAGTGIWDAGRIEIESEVTLSFGVQIDAASSKKKLTHSAEITASDFKVVVKKDSTDIDVQ